GMPNRSYIGSAGGVDVYRNDSAFGFGHYFDALDSEGDADRMPVPDRDRLMLDKLIVENPDQLRRRLTAVPAPKASAKTADRVAIRRINERRLTGELDASGTHVLLLAMSYDRGWHVTLDGADADIFRVDYGLSGVIVPAGRHRLTLIYTPVGRVAGWWLAATAVILVIAFRWWWRDDTAYGPAPSVRATTKNIVRASLSH
ncbi:MAG: YfhO family protein, partial [Rhodanobacteraceae bacterium]